jgi:hypothetical protein
MARSRRLAHLSHTRGGRPQIGGTAPLVAPSGKHSCVADWPGYDVHVSYIGMA